MPLGQDLKYDGYEQVLKETAITHDSKGQLQLSQAYRMVHKYEVYTLHPPDSGEDLDINSFVDTVLAHKTLLGNETSNSRNKNSNSYNPQNENSLMPKAACLQLSSEAKSI